ncbi:MAG: response regulator [Pseudomonadota bacterium]
MDDEPDQREIATSLLKALGYSAVAVASGPLAVEHVTRNRVDLILLDMIMDPGMGGLETYKRILAVAPDQKAVIASGYSRSAEVEKTVALGAASYIKKPYTIQKLGETIQKALKA